MPQKELCEFIVNIYYQHEACEWWALEAVADTYMVITAMFTMKKKEKYNFVKFLWNERCTMPGEDITEESEPLCVNPYIMDFSLKILGPLLNKKFDIHS